MATITLRGKDIHTSGDVPRVGSKAPDFTLTDTDLRDVGLSEWTGRKKLLSIFPSIDTPVCALSTKKFNEQLASYGDRINALTVSLDLPFAQNRFCGAEGIKNLRSASDYQDRSFGRNWGMLIEELKILARGTFVLDKDGKVVYAQQVKEVAEEPNYEGPLKALKELTA